MSYSADVWQGRRRELMHDATKDPGYAGDALRREYASLSPCERRIVDDWAATAIQGDNETERFDALDLVSHFGIRRCLPALRDLAERLERDPAPGAPFEWARVNNIIARLGTHG